jgi:hypothetical protein
MNNRLFKEVIRNLRGTYDNFKRNIDVLATDNFERNTRKTHDKLKRKLRES